MMVFVSQLYQLCMILRINMYRYQLVYEFYKLWHQFCKDTQTQQCKNLHLENLFCIDNNCYELEYIFQIKKYKMFELPGPYFLRHIDKITLQLSFSYRLGYFSSICPNALYYFEEGIFLDQCLKLYLSPVFPRSQSIGFKIKKG